MFFTPKSPLIYLVPESILYFKLAQFHLILCLFFTFQFETLVVFDTSQNKTKIVAANPALYWKGGVLPDDEPENFNGRPNDGGVGWASRAALVFMAPLLRTFISLLFFFIIDVGLCLFFSPRAELSGCDHDCFECQRCRGYSHSSPLLQVNSSEDNAGRNTDFQTCGKERKQCQFSE